jgi:Flp pilus assembly protein CpaB
MPELTTNLKNILIAAVLAIAAVALTLIYVSNSKSNQSAASPAAYRTVLVAARDIPVGTTGTQLAHAGWLTTRRIPSDAVASGTVPNSAALATLVAIQPTYHGEQIVAQRFGTSQQEGLVSTIHGPLRIFQLPGDSNQLLAGIVRQGNRVDVVGSVARPEGSQNHYGVIAVRNVLVVKAPSSSSSNSNPGSIDLQLTSAQAQKLFWMEKNADWSLLLRPSVHPSNADSAPVTSNTIVEGSSAR